MKNKSIPMKNKQKTPQALRIPILEGSLYSARSQANRVFAENLSRKALDRIQSRTKSKAKNHYYIRLLIQHFGLESLDQTNVPSSIARSYAHSLDCGSFMHFIEGKLRLWRCNERMCTYCSRCRTAQLIAGYSKQLEPLFKAKQLYSLTLTHPTIHRDAFFRDQRIPNGKNNPNSKLSRWVRWITKKKYFREANGVKKGLVWIRSIEAHPSISDVERVHPHLHNLVEGLEYANWIMARWLEFFPEAKRAAQNLKLADKGSLKEIFKYMGKPTQKRSGRYDLNELKTVDLIFRALKGKRLIQTSGAIKKVEILKNEEEELSEIAEVTIVEKGKNGEDILHVFTDFLFRFDVKTGLYVSETGTVLIEVKHSQPVLKSLNMAFAMRAPPAADQVLRWHLDRMYERISKLKKCGR